MTASWSSTPGRGLDDYDAAIDFCVRAVGFRLVEDTRLGEHKRWVVLAPPGAQETGLLLAQAATADQRERIGGQTGGRVGLFLGANDFDRDHERMRAAGAQFAKAPRHEPDGTLAIFEDLYGNRWDLIQPARQSRSTIGLRRSPPVQVSRAWLYAWRVGGAELKAS
jgi:catechol 2,3-dioxygenase-like lactoylglutathione lyase family enzyme